MLIYLFDTNRSGFIFFAKQNNSKQKSNNSSKSSQKSSTADAGVGAVGLSSIKEDAGEAKPEKEKNDKEKQEEYKTRIRDKLLNIIKSKNIGAERRKELTAIIDQIMPDNEGEAFLGQGLEIQVKGLLERIFKVADNDKFNISFEPFFKKVKSSLAGSDIKRKAERLVKEMESAEIVKVEIDGVTETMTIKQAEVRFDRVSEDMTTVEKAAEVFFKDKDKDDFDTEFSGDAGNGNVSFEIKKIDFEQRFIEVDSVDVMGKEKTVRVNLKDLGNRNNIWKSLSGKGFPKDKDDNYSEAVELAENMQGACLKYAGEKLKEYADQVFEGITHAHSSSERQMFALRKKFVVEVVFRELMRGGEGVSHEKFGEIRSAILALRDQSDESIDDDKKEGIARLRNAMTGMEKEEDIDPNSAAELYEAFEEVVGPDDNLDALVTALEGGTLDYAFEEEMYRDYYKNYRKKIKKMKKQLETLNSSFKKLGKVTDEEDNSAQSILKKIEKLRDLINEYEANFNADERFKHIQKEVEEEEKEEWREKYEKDHMGELVDMSEEEKEAKIEEEWDGENVSDEAIEKAKEEAEGIEKKILVKGFFSALLKKSEHKSAVLGCILVDPKLLDLGAEILEDVTARAIALGEDVGLKVSANTSSLALSDEKQQAAYKLAYKKSGKAKKLFSAMQNHISDSLDEYAKINRKDKELEEKTKDIDKKQLAPLEKKKKELYQLQAPQEKIEEIDKQIEKVQEKKEKIKKELEDKKNKLELAGVVSDDKDKFGAVQDAYSKLYEKLGLDSKGVTLKGIGGAINKFLTDSGGGVSMHQIIKAAKMSWDAYVEDWEAKQSVGAGKVLGFAQGKFKNSALLGRINDQVFREQKSLFQKEFDSKGGKDMIDMFKKRDPRLGNKACLFVAIEKMVADIDFDGWNDPDIKAVIQKYYPKILDGRRGPVSYEKDPDNYMDALFNANGYGLAMRRNNANAEAKLYEDTKKAFMRELEFADNQQEVIERTFSSEALTARYTNPIEIFAWLDAAWEHRQSLADPMTIIKTLNRLSKIKYTNPETGETSSLITRGGIHQLAGENKDTWVALQGFIKNQGEDRLMKSIDESPVSYIAEFGFEEARDRADGYTLDPPRFSKYHAKETRQALIFGSKGPFDRLVYTNQKSLINASKLKNWYEFIKATDSDGMIWEYDWHDPKYEQKIKEHVRSAGFPSGSFEEMIEYKRRRALEVIQKQTHPQGAEDDYYDEEETVNI